MLNDVMARNRSWSATRQAQEPGYFTRPTTLRAPEHFWIGWSDSRVPANVVAGLDPGEVSDHRNVAKTCPFVGHEPAFAAGVCGESLEGARGHRLRSPWLRRCKGRDRGPGARAGGPLAGTHPAAGAGLRRRSGPPARTAARRGRLAEFNEIEGLRRFGGQPLLQRTWARGAHCRVRGPINGLKDGLLRDLDGSIGPGHFKEEAAQ